MKVILLKEVKGIGKEGTLADVSDGHGRNYLIPKGFAKEASAANIRELDQKKAAEEEKKQTKLKEAKELAGQLEKEGITIQTKSGEGGRLFGSVTSKDIAEQLMKERQIEVDKRKILLENPIKQAGEYVIDVKLYHDVTAKVKVNIKV